MSPQTSEGITTGTTTTSRQPAARSHGRFGHYRPYVVYLVYLVFLFSQPAFDPTSTWVSWASAIALMVLFAPLYLWTAGNIDRRPYLRSVDGRPGAMLGVIGMLLLGLTVSPFNSGATTFLIYAASVVGHLQPRRRALSWLAGIFVLIPIVAALSSVPLPYALLAFGPAAFFVPVLGLEAVSETERRYANLRLSMAQDEIGRLATIAERERIARDLHDLLGHTLSSITLKAELASKLAPIDSARAAAEMQDVERISRDALAQVRSAVRGYRSRGLEGEVANSKLAFEASGITFDYFVEPLVLSADRESVLSLALREAVTNVVRHSQAGRSSIRLRGEGSFALLDVADDGVGGADLAGNGLSAMRARVETLGGTLRIEPLSPGTRVRVSLPMGQIEAAVGLPQNAVTT